MDCDCHSYYDDQKILFCPLHAHAEEMRDALEEMVRATLWVTGTALIDNAVASARTLLAKVQP